MTDEPALEASSGSPERLPEEPPPAEARQGPETARILVVDDEADLAEVIRQKFRRRVRRGELEFHFARDGHEALEQIRAHPDLDLVLTDINMPKMDGLTLLAELAKLDRDALGAVVVTAYGDMLNIRTAMNRGAFDFVTKPIDLEDLEQTVDRAVEMVRRQKRAAHARETVERYLSGEVAEELLSSPEATKLGGERRRVTILFSDLRGFSALSERLDPERVVEVLNTYLGRMTEVIGDHGGTIDEIVGDGLLVLFGAPVQREDHARRAVACALAMQLAMPDVNERVRALGIPPLEMGIGINTGDVVVGTIGSERRAKYAVVGSPVNMAGRIEAATVGGQILVSEATRREAGADVEVRRTLHLAAKGFAEPIPLHDVAGIGPPHGLRLPATAAALVGLPTPVPVRYQLLDGKRLEGEPERGRLTALAKASALLQAERPLELLTDLKLFALGGPGGALPEGDAYAKVMEHGADGYVLRFTALDDELAEALARLRETAGGAS